jgi:hypothetical protein
MTAAHYTRGRRRRNRLGLHYSRFPPISADRLLVHQLLAGPKLENPVANRRSQVSAALAVLLGPETNGIEGRVVGRVGLWW